MRRIYHWDREQRQFVEHRPAPRVQTHYIQTDTMAPARHPATGEMMDSKSAFRRETKARGLTEVGNAYERTPYREPVPQFPDPIPVMRELYK